VSDGHLSHLALLSTLSHTRRRTPLQTIAHELHIWIFELIRGGQVSELPLNGRNFMELLTLVPGVAPAEAFSITNKG